MATLAKLLAGMMLVDGALLASRTHDYLRLWTGGEMPAWIRERAEPYQELPDRALREMGIWEIAMAGLIVALASRCEA